MYIVEARSLWYRIICQKISTTQYLSQIGTVDSPTCIWCPTEIDTIDHFLVRCPKKNDIWSQVLSCQFPTWSFTNEEILQMLLKLKLPFSANTGLAEPFAITISTTVWYIWIYYWNSIIDKLPFIPTTISKIIIAQISILTAHDLID
ncbi:hypothetical protein BDF21DRAFT_76810 [Thamnidium elegans]|nr:hypothetical protein BDF21DRAFT_76810 [Thamnidium elegans]